MEALKVVGVKPISVIAQKTEPKKPSSLSTISPFKNLSFSNFKGALVLLSSILTTESAKSLTFNESDFDVGVESDVDVGGFIDKAITESAKPLTFNESDFDVSGFLDKAITFAAENPIIVGSAAAVVAVPVVVAQLFSKAKLWGVESARVAYEKLGGDIDAQLLDIRSTTEIKRVGGPDLKNLKKKVVGVVYKGDDKQGFLKKLFLKFKDPGNTTLFILDKFDGNSELVAELVTSNGFKAAYAIKDGAEGPRGWVNSGLPWILPKATLDLSNLTDAISDAFGEASDAVPVALGVAAATAGLGLLAFAEVETILQILGSAALVQFASKKLLFAEDRKQTIQQIEEILNTKVAPKELVGDIQQIGKALLPLPVNNNKALPAPAEASPAPSETAALKSEFTAEATDVPPKVEAAPEPTPEVNSVPKSEVEKESLPGLSTPLSPYPNYPDYKPPSSPIPSKP